MAYTVVVGVVGLVVTGKLSYLVGIAVFLMALVCKFMDKDRKDRE